MESKQDMMALDTNVLLRCLLNDDTAQTARVQAILAQHQKPFFIPVLVVCETCWVLQRFYRLTKQEILVFLENIAANDDFLLENEDVLQQAIQHYTVGKADFADYVIALTARQHGADAVLTFDKAASDSPYFQSIP